MITKIVTRTGTPQVHVGDTVKKGDILLTKENADTTIGDQGYTLEIGDSITIKSTTYQGVFFGTRSVLQAISCKWGCTDN